jgi:hypothetical protein
MDSRHLLHLSKAHLGTQTGLENIQTSWLAKVVSTTVRTGKLDTVTDVAQFGSSLLT